MPYILISCVLSAFLTNSKFSESRKHTWLFCLYILIDVKVRDIQDENMYLWIILMNTCYKKCLSVFFICRQNSHKWCGKIAYPYGQIKNGIQIKDNRIQIRALLLFKTLHKDYQIRWSYIKKKHYSEFRSRYKWEFLGN